MSYERLMHIDKPFFSHYDVAHELGLTLGSAEVLCTRYVKKGLLTRLKRGLYARSETLGNLDQMNLFRIANILQVPSYISLTTALAHYGICPPNQRGFYESISIKRTRAFKAGALSFYYTKIQPDLYRDFIHRDGVFIALPEKAILDCLYLASMGRYAMDGSSIDFAKVNERVLSDLSALYPPRARRYFEGINEKIVATKTLRHKEQR
jgi:predicted transcriptional regulator of viral defense system